MKRTIAILLLMGMSLSLFACGGGDTGGNDSTAETTDPSTSEESTTEAEQDYLASLSEKNYNGAEFTIIGRQNEIVSYNFPSDSETGEAINDALYYRNRSVEEAYNLTFRYVTTTGGADTAALVESEVMAGGDTYDMVQGAILTCGKVLLSKGLLSKINDMEYIDLTKPWWSQTAAESLSIGGNIYFITGYMLFEHYREAGCVLFNKTMVQDYGIEDLYALANNGTWTFDKLVETTKNVAADLNNDGVADPEDQYAIAATDLGGFHFFFGSGETITHFNNKIPYLDEAPSEKVVDVIDKLSAFFGDKSLCIDNYDHYLTVPGVAWEVFRNGNSLYLTGGLGDVINYRDSDVDFGILPVPKYSETQPAYISYANPHDSSSVVFPKVMKDPEMSGLVTEALAYESGVYFKPVMYDNILKTRASRDEESSAMLDIIYTTKCYDLCDVFEWGNINILIRDNVLGRSNTLASDYASQYVSAVAAMQNTINLFES